MQSTLRSPSSVAEPLRRVDGATAEDGGGALLHGGALPDGSRSRFPFCPVVVGSVAHHRWSPITDYRSLVTDHWSPITGHRSLVTDHWSPITGHRSLVTDHWSPITGHRSLVTDHWSPITGHRSLVTDHWSPITGHRSLVTDHWSPITAYRSLLTDHCLPITAYRSLLTDHCLPITAYRSLLTDHCLPITTYRSLLTDHYLPITAYRSLLTDHCLPITAYRPSSPRRSHSWRRVRRSWSPRYIIPVQLCKNRMNAFRLAMDSLIPPTAASTQPRPRSLDVLARERHAPDRLKAELRARGPAHGPSARDPEEATGSFPNPPPNGREFSQAKFRAFNP